jgi:hypothetical protein
MGLEDVPLLRGSASGDGKEAPYQVIALLTFRSQQDFRKRSRLTRRSSRTFQSSRR